MQMLLSIVAFLLYVLWWVIIAQAIFSWLIAFNVINTSNDFIRQLLYALDRITSPLYRPIRRMMPDLGALDLSPLVVLLVLYILMNIVIPNLSMSLA